MQIAQRILYAETSVRKKSHGSCRTILEYGFPVVPFLRNQTWLRIEEGHFEHPSVYALTYKKLNSVALVRTRTIPTELPPPVGEVSANFCG